MGDTWVINRTVFKYNINYSLDISSSPFIDNNYPVNGVDYLSDSKFESVGVAGDYWQVCFKNYIAKIKAYKIKSMNLAVGKTHPKSWNISASNNMLNWTDIDIVTNNNDLNGPSIIKTFPILGAYNFFKCFRITIVLSHHNVLSNRLSFSEFDIFGETNEKYYFCTSSSSYFSFLHFFSITILYLEHGGLPQIA